MIGASEIQAVLLGSGGFIGTCMAGIGAYRLCTAGADKIKIIPVALTTGAEELGRLRMAIESDQSMRQLVVEQGALLKEIREDVHVMKEEREMIGRALRIMSRKIEEIHGEN